MKTVTLPPYLHDVFGEEITLIELSLILIFSVVATIAVFFGTQPDGHGLAAWKVMLILLFSWDIFAGFVANFSYSTNAYYQAPEKARSRFVFYAIHIQPLILAWLASSSFPFAIGVWVFTIASALIVNQLKSYPPQRVVAAALVGMGLIGLALFAGATPLWLLIVLAFYQLKVIYSFSVDHYAPRAI